MSDTGKDVPELEFSGKYTYAMWRIYILRKKK